MSDIFFIDGPKVGVMYSWLYPYLKSCLGELNYIENNEGRKLFSKTIIFSGNSKTIDRNLLSDLKKQDNYLINFVVDSWCYEFENDPINTMFDKLISPYLLRRQKFPTTFCVYPYDRMLAPGNELTELTGALGFAGSLSPSRIQLIDFLIKSGFDVEHYGNPSVLTPKSISDSFYAGRVWRFRKRIMYYRGLFRYNKKIGLKYLSSKLKKSNRDNVEFKCHGPFKDLESLPKDIIYVGSNYLNFLEGLDDDLTYYRLRDVELFASNLMYVTNFSIELAEAFPSAKYFMFKNFSQLPELVRDILENQEFYFSKMHELRAEMGNYDYSKMVERI